MKMNQANDDFDILLTLDSKSMIRKDKIDKKHIKSTDINAINDVNQSKKETLEPDQKIPTLFTTYIPVANDMSSTFLATDFPINTTINNTTINYTHTNINVTQTNIMSTSFTFNETKNETAINENETQMISTSTSKPEKHSLGSTTESSVNKSSNKTSFSYSTKTTLQETLSTATKWSKTYPSSLPSLNQFLNDSNTLTSPTMTTFAPTSLITFKISKVPFPPSLKSESEDKTFATQPMTTITAMPSATVPQTTINYYPSTTKRTSRTLWTSSTRDINKDITLPSTILHTTLSTSSTINYDELEREDDLSSQENFYGFDFVLTRGIVVLPKPTPHFRSDSTKKRCGYG